MALSVTEIAALARFAGMVKQRLGAACAELILFGSRARGEGHEDSDLDVLVRVKGLTRGQRRAVQDAAHDVNEGFSFFVNPCVVADEAWPTSAPALAREIAKDGILLTQLLEVRV